MRSIAAQWAETERLAARPAPEPIPQPPTPQPLAGPDEFWCHRSSSDEELATALGLMIYVTAYRRPHQLACLLWSLQAQTSKDFHVVVMHDGPDFEVLTTLKKLAQDLSISFEFRFSAVRYNDFGHSLRERAIQECATRYLLLTNDDNYYTPKFVELMLGRAIRENLDLVLCDMIHGHENPGGRDMGSYSFFATQPAAYHADIGCFIVRAERAQRVGFQDKRSAGDGTFVDDLMGLGPDLLRWAKIDKVLFVHN
ncbi:MAG: glycosyltransferase family A protein [Reyranellaceae bacterium]